MSDEVKKYFNGLMSKVTGLQCIIVSDREGVPLLKIAKDNKTPELGTRQNFLSSFSQTSLQAGKIGLGKNQAVISSYTNYQVVQLNQQPLVVTFVGGENLNTGYILAVETQIAAQLEEFKLAVNENSC